MTRSRRSGGLLAWQWNHYVDNHTERHNLLLHALTQPLFLAGSLAVLMAPFTSLWLLFGVVPAVLAIAMQGAGHRREAVAPVPFEGPLDVLTRIFVEQWVTFPRFVLSGGFARAWRNSRTV